MDEMRREQVLELLASSGDVFKNTELELRALNDKVAMLCDLIEALTEAVQAEIEQ